MAALFLWNKSILIYVELYIYHFGEKTDKEEIHMQESKNLFRGICTEEGMHNSWIHGNARFDLNLSNIYTTRRNANGQPGSITIWKCDTASLGQFTGLRDDSVSFDSGGNPFPAGEQIFEDDICVYACGTKTQIGVVVWNTDYLWFELQFETGDSISFLDIAKNRKRHGVNVQVKKIGDRFMNRDLCPWFNKSKDFHRFKYRGFCDSGWITGSFVGTASNDEVVLMNVSTQHVVAKSLGQLTGGYDDSVRGNDYVLKNGMLLQGGVPICENDILEVEFPGRIVERMKLIYDPTVAAYICIKFVLETHYSFGTIRKMQERGEVIRVAVIGNTYQGIDNSTWNPDNFRKYMK